MRIKHGLLFAIVALVAWPAVSAATADDTPTARAAATCDDHPNQASAQRAKDTRDADGDGIYRETLPCPCLPPDPRADGGGSGGGGGRGGGGSGGGDNDRDANRSQRIRARITEVTDGDTVKVRADGAPQALRRPPHRDRHAGDQATRGRCRVWRPRGNVEHDPTRPASPA